MTIIWYVLTLLLGAFGILALLRSVELLVNGGRPTSQILIVLVVLVLASQCLRKARSKSSEEEMR